MFESGANGEDNARRAGPPFEEWAAGVYSGPVRRVLPLIIGFVFVPAALMRTLDALPKPTIAVVQGAAYAGGVGLVACCDVALASRRATFCLTEVRLGIVPAVISPYVVAAIGARAARRYALTAETFDAAEAHRLGLVHEVLDEDALRPAADRIATGLLANGPQAMAAAKALISRVARAPLDDALVAHTAERIASLRASPEGQEGLSAFLEKRPPAWASAKG